MSQPRFDAEIEAGRAGATGEESPWWSVHAARYLFAGAHVRGRTLDIACGTGYGLRFLRPHSDLVIGVELDVEAARKANAEVSGDPGAYVVRADGCHLPFADGYFDTITSFETIEHLHERRTFLSELKRVLAPRGLCIISTPNAHHTEPINGKPRNPHHIYEYTPQELAAELSQVFADVRLLGQTLEARFLIPPFSDEQEKLAKKPRMRAHILLWRVLNKLPFRGRDRISYALWGQPLWPRETDYRFTEHSVETAPVLVAICRDVPAPQELR